MLARPGLRLAPAALLLLPLALSLALAGEPARAVSVGFDALADLSDVQTADLGGVAVSSALVLSESSAELLLGFPTTGTWATSEPSGGIRQGLLNSLTAQIVFEFSVPVLSVTLDVLGLPVGEGTPQTALLQAFRGDTLVDLAFSDAARIGDSGLHEDTLSVAGDGIDRVVVLPAALASCSSGKVCFDVGPTTSLFLDTLRFVPVPEPASALLVAAGLALLGRFRVGSRR